MPQSFVVGQAFWGKVQFPDGTFPAYDRPYLVVGIDGDYIEILTVSSVAGKEWKLTFPFNREISNYNPPFPKRTFVKLDSLQRVHINNLLNVSIAKNGKTLDAVELSEIIKSIIR
ncbi:MAG: hypothetical protein NC433_11080 [Clostridiales bacterium]|nr:hypothetical protein [Clostridiales bacterium]